MLQMKQISAYLFLFALLLTGCVKNNPDPVWIQIEKWELEANPALNLAEGELSQNLSEAWVYVDEKLIGVFELPVKIPVLTSGFKKIQLLPAIRNNGISSTKKVYPFCEPYIIEADLIQNETFVVNPVTRYSSITKFWKEDFEDVAFSLETDVNVSNAFLVRTLDPDKVKYGSACGMVQMTSSDSLWLGYTNAQMVLPAGKEIYLEVDYMVSVPVLTGVLAISSTEIKNNPNIQLNVSSNGEMTWKKIYIDLREIISFSTTAEYFEQYFRAILPEGQSTGEIYIDNIKVVYL
jgi:hypothetical protein